MRHVERIYLRFFPVYDILGLALEGQVYTAEYLCSISDHLRGEKEEKGMKLYHGSNVIVDSPKILKADRRLDFGMGFYLTSSYEQAERWSFLTVKRRGTGEPVITSYDFDEMILPSLKVMKFDSPSVEWLKYVSNNRNAIVFRDDSDIVIGPVANDRTMPVIKLYFAGIYDEAETIKRLLPQKLKDQYVFKSEKALNALALSEVYKSEK